MLHAGSGSEFSYNDYNYDNTNSNVSAHIASKKLISTDPASWQKITDNLTGAGNHQVNATDKAKAYEEN